MEGGGHDKGGWLAVRAENESSTMNTEDYYEGQEGEAGHSTERKDSEELSIALIVP